MVAVSFTVVDARGTGRASGAVGVGAASAGNASVALRPHRPATRNQLLCMQYSLLFTILCYQRV